jgi:hypothetical protein
MKLAGSGRAPDSSQQKCVLIVSRMTILIENRNVRIEWSSTYSIVRLKDRRSLRAVFTHLGNWQLKVICGISAPRFRSQSHLLGSSKKYSKIVDPLDRDLPISQPSTSSRFLTDPPVAQFGAISGVPTVETHESDCRRLAIESILSDRVVGPSERGSAFPFPSAQSIAL